MKKILNSIWKSPRGRVFIFITGLVVVFIIGANALIDNSKDPALSSKAAKIKIKPNQEVKIDAADQKYQDLADQQEQHKRDTARKSGQSYMTQIFSFSDADASQSKNDGPAAESTSNTASAQNDEAVDPKSFYENSSGSNGSASQTQQATYTNQQTGKTYSGYVDPKLQSEYQKQMAKSLQDLAQTWNDGYSAQTVIAASDGSDAGNGFGPGDGPVIIKAGTIMFAVIDTAVNSDQVGTPVMATIVTGPLKDTKLMGSFQRSEDRLVVQFSLMSMPSMNKSINITAYAIDSKTAQTALASDVDYHYLTRWGGLLGASFLSGFGGYYDPSNRLDSTVQDCRYINDQYVCTTRDTTSDFDYNVKYGVYNGLGSVGSALSTEMSKNFSRPPTVTLDQGTGIGVLFMSDVTATGSKSNGTVLGGEQLGSSYPPSNSNNNAGGPNNYNNQGFYSNNQMPTAYTATQPGPSRSANITPNYNY